MASEDDRRRLLELFREPLQDTDVLRTPEVLSDDVDARLRPSDPTYGRSAPTVGGGGAGWAGTALLVLAVALAVGAAVFLAMRGSAAPGVEEAGRKGSAAALPSLTEEEGEDDEVARITARGEDEALAETGAPTTAAPRQGQRGVPHAGQMRPTHFGSLGGGGKPPPKAKRVDEEDDPLFQPLE